MLKNCQFMETLFSRKSTFRVSKEATQIFLDTVTIMLCTA